MNRRIARLIPLLLVFCAACTAPAPRPQSVSALPVRFLLAFDDGPSTREPYNPTRAVLDQLAVNDVQRGIKAVFCVQTRDARAGASPAGRALMERAHAEGHVLALHTATAEGHRSHPPMSDAELADTLRDGAADLQRITGRAPALVRPPFWSYDPRTVRLYAGAGLHMLLTDINARDGKIHGFNASPRRRSHFQARMRETAGAVAQGRIPAVDGVLPVIITFHDSNPFTARHLGEYLHIVLEAAAAAGLKVADPPFYEHSAQIERAALLRAAQWMRSAGQAGSAKERARREPRPIGVTPTSAFSLLRPNG
jgi:peptidoglycan/xylan/chitin deacetylase (PgdA/CDA1 family)